MITDRIDPKIESSCAIGVDEMSWDDLNPAHYEWPTPARLREYRNSVRAVVDNVIATAPLTLPITWESPLWTVLMGIEHERIHLETSSVLIRQLDIAYVRPQPLWTPCPFATVDMAKLPAPVSVEEAGYAEYNSLAGADPAVSTRIVPAPGPLSPERAAASAAAVAAETPANALVPVPGGPVSLGKPADHHLYGWDNEYGTAESVVADFQAGKFLVSNGEYYEFIKAGGYTQRQWWSDEGWGFVSYMKRNHPVFWVPVTDPDGGVVTYKYRTMTEEIEMPWAWPVDVCCLEAQAFCRWKHEQTGAAARGKEIRLPSEAEWMRVRDYATLKGAGKTAHEDDGPFWPKAPGNINLEYWASSCPVNMFNHHGSGIYDVIGNVWQHTESVMAPYSGFRVHPVYDDFTVPTFDNMHNLIKGGAWIATGNEAQTLARYAFRRHFYQHAGFRYIEAEAGTAPTTPQERVDKEDEPGVTNIIYNHFRDLDLDVLTGVTAAGDAAADLLTSLNLPQYPIALANAVTDTVKRVQQTQASDDIPALRTGKALEIGCHAGRGTFELARTFDSVSGLDFTTRIIKVGTALKTSGVVTYDLPEAGSLTAFHKVDLTAPAAAGSGLNQLRDKVEFVQGDACNLDLTRFNGYDLVVVASGFNTLYQPERLLTSMVRRVNLGGLVVIASDDSWNAATTPVANWLGGYKDPLTGERVEVVDAIAAALGTGFARVPMTQDSLVQAQRKLAGEVTVTKMYLTAWRKVGEPMQESP